MTAPTTCLWFDFGKGEEAARFYVSLFPNSSIDSIWRYPPGTPGPEGDVMFVEFTLDGRPFQALAGGPAYAHSEAASLSVECADQAEVDRYWAALTADGGIPGVCGWLKDRLGVSWQIVPRRLADLQRTGDPARVGRMMRAMGGMAKLDVAALETAYEG